MTSLRRFILAITAVSLVSSGVGSAQVRSSRTKTPRVANSRARFVGKSLESAKSRFAKRRVQSLASAEPVLQPTVAPTNDECTGALPFNQDFDGNAITTSPAYAAPVDVAEATTNAANDPAASCQTDVSRSVWYTFTPTVTGAHFISSCADAPTKTTVIDPIISIYTAPAGCGASTNFTEVPTQGAGTTGATDGCDDDSCFTEAQAVVQTQLTAGTTYYIVARQFQNVAPNANESILHLRVSRATARIAQPGEVLISEFRLSGNGNQRDEYVELFNATSEPLNIGDIFGVASFDPALVGVGDPGDGVFVVGVSPGVVIPPRGYYLITNVFGTASSTAYSISSTPGNNRRTDFDGDYFLDNRGLAFVRLESNNNLTTIDAVGFSSDSQGNSSYAGATGNTSPNGFVEGTAITYTGSGTGGAIASQASFVRRLVGATPVDSGNNANDFVLVSTAGPNAGVTSNLTSNVNGMAVLGAPNPQNLQAPYRGTVNPMVPQLVDAAVGGNSIPNAQRFNAEVGPNASQGTLAFRRQFTNQGNRDVTSLRFRFVNLTTLGSPNQIAGGGNQADGRLLSSPGGGRVTITRTNGSTVRLTNLTLDPPSVEGSGGLGGGLYSSASVPFPASVIMSGGTVTTADRIRPGEAVVIEFLFGINNATSGTFRYATVVEINQPARQ